MKFFNKKIIIYSAKDKIFTFPILYQISKLLSKKYKIDIYLGETNYKRKIKILLVFALFGSMPGLVKLFFKRVELKKILKLKGVNIVKDVNKKKYKFGISLFFTKKIIKKNYPIFNLHLGNFKNQRGSFIFFYKFLYNWNHLDLTFHKINEIFDAGTILFKKKIKIKSMNATDICSIYLHNINFIKKSIATIENKVKIKKNKTIGKLNIEPSFFLILKTFFKIK